MNRPGPPAAMAGLVNEAPLVAPLGRAAGGLGKEGWR